MEQLIHSLQNLLIAGWEVLITVLALVLPWSPLIAWIAFWLFAVNWEKLYPVLARGGLIAVMLIGLTMILVWGLIAPPESGAHRILGLNVTNSFVGKTFYVAMLLSIMGLCGAVQLSGACGSLVSFPEDEPDDHGHGGGSHDHDDHGHDDGHSTHSPH